MFASVGAASAAGVTVAGATVTGGALLAAVGVAAVGGAKGGVAILDTLATLFQGSDDFYMEVDNERFWPQVDDMYMAPQDTAYINKTATFEDVIRIDLKDHDHLSSDDTLGFLEIDVTNLETAFIDNKFIVSSAVEGSIYELDIRVDK